MNKSVVSEIIETFDAEIWQKEVPTILEREGITVFEDWIDKHTTNEEIIDRFADLFIECYEWFSPQQPRNLYIECSPDKIMDIVNRVHQSGDHIEYEALIKAYIYERTKDV